MVALAVKNILLKFLDEGPNEPLLMASGNLLSGPSLEIKFQNNFFLKEN
jgi:hypothetical protein